MEGDCLAIICIKIKLFRRYSLWWYFQSNIIGRYVEWGTFVLCSVSDWLLPGVGDVKAQLKNIIISFVLYVLIILLGFSIPLLHPSLTTEFKFLERFLPH